MDFGWNRTSSGNERLRTKADKSEKALDKVHLGVHLDSFMVGCEADIVSLDGNSGEKSKIECTIR